MRTLVVMVLLLGGALLAAPVDRQPAVPLTPDEVAGVIGGDIAPPTCYTTINQPCNYDTTPCQNHLCTFLGSPFNGWYCVTPDRQPYYNE